MTRTSLSICWDYPVPRIVSHPSSSESSSSSARGPFTLDYHKTSNKTPAEPASVALKAGGEGNTAPVETAIYNTHEPPEDHVVTYCNSVTTAGKSSAKNPDSICSPASVVLANVAAPFYLYTQLKGKLDLWDKILKGLLGRAIAPSSPGCWMIGAAEGGRA
jgi:hypothetical protein